MLPELPELLSGELGEIGPENDPGMGRFALITSGTGAPSRLPEPVKALPVTGNSSSSLLVTFSSTGSPSWTLRTDGGARLRKD